jgi:hypothetical protein
MGCASQVARLALQTCMKEDDTDMGLEEIMCECVRNTSVRIALGRGLETPRSLGGVQT